MCDILLRRMDILWVPFNQYPFGVLYFTGSGFFNIQMRRIALEKGFTLNEYEILPIGSTVEIISSDFEINVFDAGSVW